MLAGKTEDWFNWKHVGLFSQNKQNMCSTEKTESECISKLTVMETCRLDYSWYAGSLEGSLSEDLSYGNPRRDFK